MKTSTNIFVFIVIILASLHSLIYLFSGGPSGPYRSLINTNRFPLTFTFSPLPLVFDSDMFFTKTTIQAKDENLEIIKEFDLDAGFFSKNNYSNHIQLHLMRYPYFVEVFPENNLFDKVFCALLDQHLPEYKQKAKTIQFIEIILSDLKSRKVLPRQIQCK